MTGALTPVPTDWTFGTLLYHVERMLKEQDVRYNERQTASNKAIEAALLSAAAAVNKAEVATESRFQSVNEFRKLVNDLLADQKETMMPRKEVELLFASAKGQNDKLSEQMRELSDKVSVLTNKITGEKIGRVDTWKDMAVVISLVVSVMAVASRFIP